MTSEGQKEFTLKQHLEELRSRLLVTAISALIGTIITFAFHRQILVFLQKPATGISGIETSPLVYTHVTEMLGISMKISFMGGLILALPVLTYQFIAFISPGLTKTEKRYLLLLLPGVSIGFISGVTFGYFVLIPAAIKFFLTFNADIAAPMIRIGNYINLMTNLLFWNGLVFETPVLMFALAKLRIINHRRFSQWRKFAIVMAFLLGALITPTFDPINQTLVAIPIVILYELGIWLAWLANRKGDAKSQTE